MATSATSPTTTESTTTTQTTTESTTTADRSVSTAEVDRLVARARQEEKDKLYADLQRARTEGTTLDSKVKTLEAEVNSLRGTATNAETLKAELAALKVQQSSSEVNFRKILDEALTKQQQDFQDHVRKVESDALRTTVIAGFNGRIIPDLVSGSTEQEIRASAQRAHERFEAIAKDVEDRAKAEYEKKLQTALPQPIEPNAAATSADIQGGIKTWRSMSPSDWEKNREAIKAEAFKKAGMQLRQS